MVGVHSPGRPLVGSDLYCASMGFSGGFGGFDDVELDEEPEHVLDFEGILLARNSLVGVLVPKVRRRAGEPLAS